MSIFNLFSRNDPWKTGDFPTVWDSTRPSILDHLLALKEQGRNPNTVPLPDTPPADEKGQFRPAAGLIDNISGPDKAGAEQIARQILEIQTATRKADFAALYNSLKDQTVVRIVDDVLRRIVEANPDATKIAKLALWLVTKAPDREPIKMGLAILGLMSSDRFNSLFIAFGRHEEFAKFSGVALDRTLAEDDSLKVLWDLARSLHGWGRIDIVKRIAPRGDATFRHWLVREGFQNSIMDEYLAATAAVDGQLAEQLAAPDAGSDTALLDGATRIIRALCNPHDPGGSRPPVADFYDIPDGATAARRWLALIAAEPPTMDRAKTAALLIQEAEMLHEDFVWSKEDAAAIRDMARAYIKQDATQDLIAEAFASDDYHDAASAYAIVKDAGLDGWQLIFDWTSRDSTPVYPSFWYSLMQTDDADRARQAAELAERRLPLAEIASGPDLILGFESISEKWKSHQDLGQIVAHRPTLASRRTARNAAARPADRPAGD